MASYEDDRKDLSIPLNGFGGALGRPRACTCQYALSIPLNGFPCFKNATDSSELLGLSIPLNGFHIPPSDGEDRLDPRVFQFH